MLRTIAPALFVLTSALPAQDLTLDWLRTDGGPGLERPSRAVVFADGSSALFGDGSGSSVFGSTTLPADMDDSTNWIVRLEADGTPRWAAALHLDGFRYISVGLAAEPDGSVLLATHYTSRLTAFDSANASAVARIAPDDRSKGIVLRYGPTGSVAVVHELVASATNHAPDVKLFDLARGNDGSLTLIGSFTGRLQQGAVQMDSASAGGDMLLLRYDAQGQADWGQQASAQATFGNHLVGLPDGSVMVLGFHNQNVDFGGGTVLPGGLYRRFLARYDVGGALLWARAAIHNPAGDSNVLAFDLAARGDGSTYLAGYLTPTSPVVFGDGTAAQTVTPAGPGGTAFVGCFGADGELRYVRTSEPGNAVAMGVAVLPDDSFVVGGFFRGSLSFAGIAHAPITGPGPNTSTMYLAHFDPSGAALQDLEASTAGFVELQHLAASGYALVAAAMANGNLQIGGGTVATVGNDMFTSRWTATPAPLHPNLVLRPDLVQVEAATIDRCEVTATVLNLGAAASPATTVNVRVERLDGSSRTVPYDLGPIAPGGSQVLQRSLNEHVENLQAFVVTADPDNLVAEDDPFSAQDEEADNAVRVAAGTLWDQIYACGFESGELWELSEEIYNPAYYDDGLAALSYPAAAARTGGHGLRIHANAAGSLWSNIAIAFHRVSAQFEPGLWRYSFHVRLPLTGEGQAAPTFTMQNTRFLPGSTTETETFEAGFQYVVSDEAGRDSLTWSVWVNGNWRRVNWAPALQPGVWYRITLVVDFTNARYRQLVIEAPGDPTFTTVRRTLHHAVPAARKGFGAEGFVVSVEGENKFTTASRVTQYAVDCDDVALERARTR